MQEWFVEKKTFLIFIFISIYVICQYIILICLCFLVFGRWFLNLRCWTAVKNFSVLRKDKNSEFRMWRTVLTSVVGLLWIMGCGPVHVSRSWCPHQLSGFMWQMVVQPVPGQMWAGSSWSGDRQVTVGATVGVDMLSWQRYLQYIQYSVYVYCEYIWNICDYWVFCLYLRTLCQIFLLSLTGSHLTIVTRLVQFDLISLTS